MKNPDRKTDLESDGKAGFLLPELAKLQVPMKKAIYDVLKTRAKDLGFDSVQSYVRFWAAAETAGSRPRPPQLTRLRPVAGPGEWIELEIPAPDPDQPAEAPLPSNRPLDHPDAQALRYLELLLATNPNEPPTLGHALEYVHKQLARAQGIKHLDNLLYAETRRKTGVRVG